MPVAVVSVVDITKEVVLGQVGLQSLSTPRNDSLCAHVILPSSPMQFIIPDLSADRRFLSNPLVRGRQPIRFYAAVPIVVEGIKLGALSVMDVIPHTHFSDQMHLLEEMAGMIGDLFCVRHAVTAAVSESAACLHGALMQYVSAPLQQTNAIWKGIEECIADPLRTAEGLERMLRFDASQRFLDAAIHTGIQLTLLNEQLVANALSKEIYLSRLSEEHGPYAVAAVTEVEEMFAHITEHIHFDSASYAGNSLAFRWNSISIERQESTDTLSMHELVQRTAISCKSCKSSRMPSFLLPPPIAIAPVPTASEIMTDKTVLFGALCGVLSAQQAAWQRVQLSSGVIHSDCLSDMSTVLLRFTFHDHKGANSADMSLLAATLQAIGGCLRLCEDIVPFTRIIEITLPGHLRAAQDMFPLSCSSGVIKTHHTPHGTIVSSKKHGICVLSAVSEPEDELLVKALKHKPLISSKPSTPTKCKPPQSAAVASPASTDDTVQDAASDCSPYALLLEANSERSMDEDDIACALSACGSHHPSLLRTLTGSSKNELDMHIQEEIRAKTVAGVLTTALSRITTFFHAGSSAKRVVPVAGDVYAY